MTTLSRQARLVLDHLRCNQHLTSWQAEGVYKIRRLASRVDELRAAGFEVTTSRSKDATGQPYTRYSLSTRQRRAKRPLLPTRSSPTQFRIDSVAAAYTAYCRKSLDMDAEETAGEVDQFLTFLKDHA